MYKVISPRSCRESAETLQEYLNVRYPCTFSDSTVLINWGNSRIERHDPILVFGNRRESVGRSSDKNIMFQLLHNLGTVPVVTEYTEPGVYQHHGASLSDGRGVRFVERASDFVPGVLSTQRVIGAEFRVYFCYNQPKLIYKKVKLNATTPDSTIQCSTTGYGYQSDPTELRRIIGFNGILKEYTKKVANRLELSYGAVDFILEKDTNMVYILEVNSAPTLFVEEIVDTFAQGISEQLNGD